MEAAGYIDDQPEEEDLFDKTYEEIFDNEDYEVDADVEQLSDSKERPQLRPLNQSKLSKRELDELFLEH